MTFSAYQTRPIRFLEIHQAGEWTVKIYSLSSKNERVPEAHLNRAKSHLKSWLANAASTTFKTYGIATLILHECREGCFAIVNWWIDENMLQHYVYLDRGSGHYELFSDSGIVTCVWESAIIWFERNAWVEHVLMKNTKPDFKSYLNQQLNDNL